MTTEFGGTFSDQLALGVDAQYCPRCSHRRVGQLRLCSYCRFDFDVPDPAVAAPTGPPTPSVRLVSPDEPLPVGSAGWGRSKRWLLLGPISLL
jgi:hypothetical protein